MNARPRLFVPLIAGCVLGGLALAGPTGAGGPGQCPKHYFCVWKHTGYEGRMVKLKGPGLSNKIKQKMDDQASSAKNRRGKPTILYSEPSGGGSALCFAAGHTYEDLSGPLFNDIASSSRLRGDNSVC